MEMDTIIQKGVLFPLYLSSEGLKWYYYDIVLWLGHQCCFDVVGYK